MRKEVYKKINFSIAIEELKIQQVIIYTDNW